MPATLFDYVIAVGILLIAFAACAVFISDFIATSRESISVSTLQMQAMSLLGLADREPAFETSISGLGLAKRMITESQPRTQITVISEDALQALAQKAYSNIKEDFDFRIEIYEGNETVFEYGAVPRPGAVAKLSKPVLFEVGNEIRRGTLAVEVW